MKRVIIFMLIAITTVSMILFQNDSGSSAVAEQMNIETMKGDIVELSGKGMYYKNIHGSYPVHSDNVYSMDDAEVISSLQVFERYYDKDYIENNLKLANVGELKNQGITYDLANPQTRYFYDVTTGDVISADLIDLDPEFADNVGPGGGFRVVDTITIIDSDNPSLIMTRVNGSFRSGSTMYFYGGGPMKLARRDEMTREIRQVESGLGLSGSDEILYIQPSTNKAAIFKSGEVSIVDLDI